MDCSKCGKPAIISIKYVGKNYCESCFSEYFERKVLATLRGSLPSHGKVGFDTTTLGGKVAMHIIKPFAIKARDTFVELRDVSLGAKNVDLLITGETLDDLNADTLAYLLDIKENLGEVNSAKPLAKCTDEETKTYARIKGISGKTARSDQLTKLLKKELNELEEKHPGTKLALLKTRKYLLSLEI